MSFPKNLQLKDSQFVEGVLSEDAKANAFYLAVIDELSKNAIDIFSFSGQTLSGIEAGDIIKYQVEGVGRYGKVSKVSFYTSHYIGFYSTVINRESVSISILPRMGYGSTFFNYLISYAYGLYIPKEGASGSDNQNKQPDCYWMMAMLWKASLDKALASSQIPKEYIKRESNDRFFRGRLNLTKQIKYNLVDQSRFHCSYKKLTMNTAINQAIRQAYSILKQNGCSVILKDLDGYDQRLASFGVENKIGLHKIDQISYSRLNVGYKGVIQLSKAILLKKLSATDILNHKQNSFSYFLDLAELWENYLLKVLQRNLDGYRVYSPNQTGGSFLLQNKMRSIRPDILIEKNGRVVAVLDAKYKRYKKIGRTAGRIAQEGVSRDDLYQMMTYLYHYGEDDKSLIGLFISPEEGAEDAPHILEGNKTHRIGVLNLNIRQFEEGAADKFSRSKIQDEEKSFVKKIRGLLEPKAN